MPADFFICHASEDKAQFVRGLAHALEARGAKVWYDEFELNVGDSLFQAINEGLRTCRYGVVVLSQAFFAKGWAQWELEGLVQRQTGGERVILPIWHGVSRDDVASYSLPLASIVGVNSALGTATVVERLLQSSQRPRPGPAQPLGGAPAPLDASAEDRLAYASSLFKQDDLTAALLIWQDLTNSDDRVVATIAWFNAGVVLARQGRVRAARQAYEQALFSPHHGPSAASAGYNLGRLLEDAGETAAAENAYRRATEIDEDEVAFRAALNLGFMVAGQGQSASAEHWWQLAAQSPEPEVAGMALNNLGLMLADGKRFAEAEEVLREATELPSRKQADAACLNLGRLLAARGANNYARSLWIRAAASPFPEVASLARLNLEKLEGRS
jgi:Tfp pilus assembly protein PilF